MTDLARRYGTRRRPRWVWPVVAGVGIALGVAWAAWIAFQPRPVTADVYGYDVVDDHLVQISLNVRRPEPLPVRCTVYAQAQDHGVVGEKTVDVPAGEQQRTRVTIDVKTERRAINGALRTCQSLG